MFRMETGESCRLGMIDVCEIPEKKFFWRSLGSDEGNGK